MTTENNKIIAEFMNHYENMGNKGLLYHSDWNWLIEVVEKIETTSYNVPEKFQRGFMKNTLTATGVINSDYDNRKEFIGWSSSAWLGTKTIWDSTLLGENIERYKTKIEAVYNACVEFIKWYNEQNK